MITFEATLLEKPEIGNYEGSVYASVVLRSSEVADNTLLKYKVDLKSVSNADYNELQLDAVYQVTCELLKGFGGLATVKVVKFE